ncbi:retrovirus-related pol polyprotein from transposon TNT 1-94 [Tanacetum coccineum]|uniref:Retrovirus-related pol polyprotein from transposon TNT 1-94 n=1 Tax=Tanacetum coccineum TaxID=301880 RepID=A0ABQ5B6X4_9ASTR
MFDELLTSPPSVDHPAPKVIASIAEVVAPVPAVSTGSRSSTTVDQDAQSLSNSQTTPETQPPVIPNDVEEDNHDIDVAHMGNDSLLWFIQFQKSLTDQASFSKYALESLKKYGFDSYDPMDTPMVEKSKLDEDKEGKAVDPSYYRGMIGTLLYLTARTVNRGLWYPKDSSIALTSFSDADHAGCQDTRPSTSGSMQFLGDRLVSHGHQKGLKSAAILQLRMLTYISCGLVCQNSLMRSQLPTMALDSITNSNATVIIKSAYCLKLKQCPSTHFQYQLADIFTKALARERIEFLINKLGMRSFSPETLKQLDDEVVVYGGYLFKYSVSYALSVPEAEGRPAVQQHTAIETVLNMTPENKEHFQSEKEAIFLLFNMVLEVISIQMIDAMPQTANMICGIAIEGLQRIDVHELNKEKQNLQLQQCQCECLQFLPTTSTRLMPAFNGEVNDSSAERIAKVHYSISTHCGVIAPSNNIHLIITIKPYQNLSKIIVNIIFHKTRSAIYRHDRQRGRKPHITSNLSSVSEVDSDLEQDLKIPHLGYNNDISPRQFARNKETMTVDGARRNIRASHGSAQQYWVYNALNAMGYEAYAKGMQESQSRYLNDVNARTKKPKVVPISASKPKRKANKSVATPHKKIVASDTTIQKSKSYYKELYENTNQEWKWWIAKKCPSGYKWTQKPLRTKKIWMPKIRKEDVSTSISPTIDIVSRITNIVQLILFIVDSGCTKHMTGNLKLLCNFVEKFLGTVRFGNDQFAPILGYGDLNQGNVTIKRVYYVEGLNHNLFSVGQFCDADLEVAFRKSTCFVRDLQGNDLLTGSRGSDLYTISLQETTSSTPICFMAKASPTQAWLWHRRLSHLNFDYITLLSKKDIVTSLPKLKYVKDQLCSSCEMSKAKRSSFKSKAVPSSKGRLNLLHMDLCGPMRVASINGKKYILVIVDDYSRYTWTLFLRSKDETPEVLKDFLTMIQRNLQAQVISVRTDRGTEFLNKTLHAYFKEEGIEHQTSTPQTPEQNGVVKRRNRTLVEAARTMLSASKLPLSFWAEAVATACYTQNRSIIISTHGKMAYHIINDRKPLIKHLHIFGCICYITRDGENLDKMKEKGDPCVMVGYSTQSKGYRVYNKSTLNSLVPQGQKASDYDNSDPVPPRQNVVPTAEKTDSSQQGLEFLFSPLLEEYYNPTHGHTEDNNNDQAPNASFQEDEFINPFCTRNKKEKINCNIAQARLVAKGMLKWGKKGIDFEVIMLQFARLEAVPDFSCAP